MPFGLRSAPAIFNTVADLFHWCLVNNWSVIDLLHYLDDYFTLGPPNSTICASRLKAIDQAANDICIPLSPEKCVGPTTCLVFLGIELDSTRMTARLPSDKHAELIALLDEWANKRWCKLKELQSLVGKLSHACAVVPLGRTFLRRLLDLLKGHSSKRSRFIRLNKECNLTLIGSDPFYQLGMVFTSLTCLTGLQFPTFFSPLMPLAARGTACFIRGNGLMAPGLWPNNHRALPTRNFSP